MAKPKVVKVRDRWHLTDLVSAGKLSDGDRVCLSVPKATQSKRKRWKFVKGTLRYSYRVYCECCGPELEAWVTKADGTKAVCWSGRW